MAKKFIRCNVCGFIAGSNKNSASVYCRNEKCNAFGVKAEEEVSK